MFLSVNWSLWCLSAWARCSASFLFPILITAIGGWRVRVSVKYSAAALKSTIVHWHCCLLWICQTARSIARLRLFVLNIFSRHQRLTTISRQTEKKDINKWEKEINEPDLSHRGLTMYAQRIIIHVTIYASYYCDQICVNVWHKIPINSYVYII